MSGPGKGADRGAWEAARALIDAGSDGYVTELVTLADASKAARKGVAAAIDGAARGLEVRAALAGLAGEALEGSTDRLLRRARGADVAAQVRRNPIAINEGFVCVSCGEDVPPAPGGGIRNHCPWCLTSQHVDGPVPGDRAADCGGAMRPVSFEGGGPTHVRQRCDRCGHERRNALHPEWLVAPDVVDPSLLSR